MRKASHRLCGPSYQMTRFVCTREVEWVVGDQDLYKVLGLASKVMLRRLNLLFVDPAALDSEAASRVQTEDRELIVLVVRIQIVVDEFAIRIERPAESLEDVVQRDIVIAGYDELRMRKLVEKRAGLFEFGDPGALCEVPGNCYQVGLNLLH